MKVISQYENLPILSNIHTTGEFRIKNSSRAFQILSSGLYANKVRAIIRELSCNAYDSHVAAGRADVPFELHLPNTLEPWFAIRDRGTGLTHEQVTNIYTTYFESTKTHSNDFVGALGLGSKSPFSYTDNFTVTAVRDGVRGIYTAFINDQGVPSIALMESAATDEPNGVEVKFAVSDTADFRKFYSEAQTVLAYFKTPPTVNDPTFQPNAIRYLERDIVPGIHHLSGGNGRSVAVMGNIAYPIDVPQADRVLGDLRRLLSCNLEINFEIGELDFQASREGLSYVPSTVEAIRARLEILNTQLARHIAQQADAIPNLWTRAIWLEERRRDNLWTAAVTEYVNQTGFPIPFDGYGHPQTRVALEQDLAEKFNIRIRAFSFSPGGVAGVTASTLTPNKEYIQTGKYQTYWRFCISNNTHFVVDDMKTGSIERTKFHFRSRMLNNKLKGYPEAYILDAADPALPMRLQAFFDSILNPPQVCSASQLDQKPRKTATAARNVTVLKLTRRGNHSRRQVDNELVWRDDSKIDSFDKNRTYYYLPLSGFNLISRYGVQDAKLLAHDLKNSGVVSLAEIEIYGVRKADLAAARAYKNWINLEDHLVQTLSNISASTLASMSTSIVPRKSMIIWTKEMVAGIRDQKSPYLQVVNKIQGAATVSFDRASLDRLCKSYVPNIQINPSKYIQEFQNECDALMARYPMLKMIERDNYRRIDYAAVTDYINLVDQVRPV